MYDHPLIVIMLHEDRVRQAERNRRWAIRQPALHRRLQLTLGNALVGLGTRLQPKNPPAATYSNRLRRA